MSVGAVNKQTGDRIPTAGMPAIDDALSATSINPVQNDIITAAFANKQDKTDNALQTTDKTVVGAVNELKSGLTNVDVALDVPENTGKNVLPMTLAGIKSANTGGTWDGNSYTYNGITYTIYDTNGKVTGIKLNGTATNTRSRLFLCPDMNIVGFNGYKMNGCPEDGAGKYSFVCQEVNSPWTIYGSDTGNGATISNAETNTNAMIFINVIEGITITNLYFYPMIRHAFTDPTFAPYIPSVESRIEAVESGLVNMLTDISTNTHLNKDSNLDTLPLGLYGINTYEGSGTGTGIPTYNTVGILWHIKGASNSFIQYIFGYNYFACRNRSNTTDAWEAWKFVHNALPT